MSMGVRRLKLFKINTVFLGETNLSGYTFIILFFLINFIFSLFGIGDWAYAVLVLCVSFVISTFFGFYRHSDKLVPSKLLRISISFVISLFAYPILLLAFYLNDNIYDGLLTIVMIFYIVLMSLALQILSKRQINRFESKFIFWKFVF